MAQANQIMVRRLAMVQARLQNQLRLQITVVRILTTNTMIILIQNLSMTRLNQFNLKTTMAVIQTTNHKLIKMAQFY